MRWGIPERSPTPTSPSHAFGAGPSLSPLKGGEGKTLLPRSIDMCGRFVQKTPLGDIRVLFETVGTVPNMPPRYNAAPTDILAVVRFNRVP